MAFAFTLTGKRRIDKQQEGTQMKGIRWALTYSFTCLSGDTSGANNIAGDVGGSLTITDMNYSLNADDGGSSIAASGSTITITKGGAAGTAGFMTAEVIAR